MKKSLYPPAVLKKARSIRLLAMDIDGVLTAGDVVVLNSGEEVKFWNVKDRIGFTMLRKSGKEFHFAWITGRGCNAVERAAREIGVQSLYQQCWDKKKAFHELLAKLRLNPEEAAYLGDDLIDVPVLRVAGLAVCPSDAPAHVKAVSHYATRVPGGRGVFRETVELILEAQGLWPEVMRHFDPDAGSK
ncbi:MAG TPA: HAD hydrolase family protein [Elusimicrobiota bacterium]|nr:HAD hydrolase family protein [Elusimicrobiota bacterium]